MHASSDDEIRELLTSTDTTTAPTRRRDALHLSGALVAVIAIMVAAGVALVAAIPYLIGGFIQLMFALDPCKDFMLGCH